jgi:hypothetical protein
MESIKKHNEKQHMYFYRQKFCEYTPTDFIVARILHLWQLQFGSGHFVYFNIEYIATTKPQTFQCLQVYILTAVMETANSYVRRSMNV